ncbi:MAG: hypothetical protein ACPLXC_02765 [Candidatus Pacearchaeota archaeon]
MVNKTNRFIKNKKGWLTIVEVVIAILILFGFVFIAMSKQAQESRALQGEPSLFEVANFLTVRAQENATIRNSVLSDNSMTTEMLRYEAQRINARLNVSASSVDIGGICSFTLADKEVYSATAIIASDSSSYNPKKLCVFLWQE